MKDLAYRLEKSMGLGIIAISAMVCGSYLLMYWPRSFPWITVLISIVVSVIILLIIKEKWGE